MRYLTTRQLHRIMAHLTRAIRATLRSAHYWAPPVDSSIHTVPYSEVFHEEN